MVVGLCREVGGVEGGGVDLLVEGAHLQVGDVVRHGLRAGASGCREKFLKDTVQLHCTINPCANNTV